MSAVFENIRARNVIALDDRVANRNTMPSGATHPLDSPASREKLSKLMEWWDEARMMHAENRYQQAIDCAFYDGLQWTDEQKLELQDRGQMALVFNAIAQHINWLIGTERRTRVDFKVHARRKDQEKEAIAKTQLLKYVSDVNKGQYARSRAFEDAVKAGVGWLEDGIRGDPSDEPLFSRTESWRYIWWDALSKEADLSDARYLFRQKWVDTDIVEAMFPDRKLAIQSSKRQDDLLSFEDDSEEIGYTGLYSDSNGSPIITGGRSFFDSSFSIGNRRQRNKLTECWYRMPTNVKVVRSMPSPLLQPTVLDSLEAINGLEYTGPGSDPEVDQYVNDGLATTYDAVRLKVWVCIWTGQHMLQDMPSPYAHDRFPFTPVWAYRRDQDGLPYGPVRNMRDPQIDLNKRRSKAIFLLSTNQLIADEDAFEDWDEAVDEAARPDGVLKKRRGAEVEIVRHLELAEEHVQLMQQDLQFMESTSGVTEENRGQVTNTNSGSAINLRQQQGSVVTAPLFDNLRRAIQQQGECQLALIEQFYSEPKIIRLTRDRSSNEYTRVNYPTVSPEGYIDVENAIAATHADFVVDTQAFRENVRLAMFEAAMEQISHLDPAAQMQFMDLAYDLSDLHNREEWVRRARKLNGAVDPDDPAREDKEAAADQQAQADKELERRLKAAEAAQKEAQAGKAKAGAEQSRSDAMTKAAEIAAILAANPQLARAVDVLMDSFGSGDSFSGLAAEQIPAGTPVQPVSDQSPLRMSEGDPNAPKE